MGATAALAAPAATGNARGIGLARAVLRAYQHVPTQSYVEHGLVWMSAMDGKAPTFQWAYGLGPYPGAYPATEHAVLTLDRGRVSWWRDDLTLAPCTKPGVCPGAPVEIVANTEVSSTRSEVRANTAVNPTRRNRPVPGRPACLDRGRAVRRTGAFRSPELVVSG